MKTENTLLTNDIFAASLIKPNSNDYNYISEEIQNNSKCFDDTKLIIIRYCNRLKIKNNTEVILSSLNQINFNVNNESDFMENDYLINEVLRLSRQIKRIII